MRLTEEEAKAAGFVKDKKGNWHERKISVPSRDSGEVPKLESDTSHASQKAAPVERTDEGSGSNRNKFRIIVTVHYRRHVDPDNINPKWFVDRLWYAGIIPDDSSEFIIEFVKRVVKVKTWEPEITTIEVYQVTEE